jgi:hypothetical protein
MPRLLRTAAPVVALLTALTLVAGACGGDSKDSSASNKTTTTASKKTTTTVAGKSSTTLPFNDALDKAESDLDKAKTDPCQLLAFFGTLNTLPDPQNAAEGKRAVTFLSTLLTAVGDTAPPSEAAAAATLKQAAKDLEAEGAAANYSKEWLTSKDTPKALSDPKVTAALTSFQTTASKTCGGTAGSPGSAPSTTTAG